MNIVTFDFETYYDSDYSLRKMTPVEYILDPRFELIGCAVRDNTGCVFLEHDEFLQYLRGMPPDTAVVSFNALFDMCVLAWRCNVVPDLMIDALGMARAMLAAHLRSLSLEKVVEHLGLGAKGKTIFKVQGMTRQMIKDAGLWPEYVRYACDDAELAYAIFKNLLARGYPLEELAVMDTVLRCGVIPQFQLDTGVLADHLHLTQVQKQELLRRCGMEERSALMSNDRFADALRSLGIEPPMKVSPATGEITYAFAKTDLAFTDLEEHDDPAVQALVSARLGVKSTIEETRTQRLMKIAALQWPDGSPWMPIPLRYSGAHTHRLSGDWKLNFQNLPRGGALRRALVAPKGKMVVAADASQIEARLVAWFCGQQDLVDAFDRGEDVYASFASTVFGFPVDKRNFPTERFIGKTAILGLGYGMGWKKFQRTVLVQSRNQLGKEIVLSDDEAQRIVRTYRTKYSQIPRMWRRLNSMLPTMTDPNLQQDIHPVTFQYQKVILPNGLALNYLNLRYENDEWRYDFGGKWKRLFGGKLLENIIQALSRICTMDAAVAVRRRLKKDFGQAIRLAMQVHDELVYVVPEYLVVTMKSLLIEEMRRRPVWGPDIPLDSEANHGPSYGEAK